MTSKQIVQLLIEEIGKLHENYNSFCRDTFSTCVHHGIWVDYIKGTKICEMMHGPWIILYYRETVFQGNIFHFILIIIEYAILLWRPAYTNCYLLMVDGPDNLAFLELHVKGDTEWLILESRHTTSTANH